MRFFFVSHFFVLSFLCSVILALMSSISAVWPIVVVHLPIHLSGLSSATNTKKIIKDVVVVTAAATSSAAANFVTGSASLSV
jgi:hypothetical protein